jgi:hypothetical protein
MLAGPARRLVLTSTEAGKQSVRVDNWRAAQLVQFLKDKLDLPARS